ncbi:GAF domain-containing protein [Arthrobacter zhaoguopingii]|uniref:GAF domain-containing protein n=1 Tax=Arthrobacter zhaoguopingii TaxID=2681491 RepID=UPI00135A54E6|nr:GAF domain-containing protein [Arthrobacter zhaoguopingii]
MSPSELPVPDHDLEGLQRLASEGRSLRDIADLVARASRTEDVFQLAAIEASRQLDGDAVTITRYTAGDEIMVVAAHAGPTPIGTRIKFGPGTQPHRVRHQKSSVRVDDFRLEVNAALAEKYGLRACVSVPVIIEGVVWGAFSATSLTGPLPRRTEDRLESFAQLVVTTIANIEAREELRATAQHDLAIRLLAEQSVTGASSERALAMTVAHALTLRGVARATINPGPMTLFSPSRSSTSMADDHPSLSYPIQTHERTWAYLEIEARTHPLPDTTDARLRNLTQVTGQVVSAILTRLHLRHLAEEQTALRRIAELIASGAAPSTVFHSIAAELSRLLADSPVVIVRFDADGPVIAAACQSGIAPGTRLPAVKETPDERSPRGSRQVDEITSAVRCVFGGDAGAHVGVPVTVADNLSGALLAAPRPDSPADTGGTDLEAFADLAAATFANARAREALIASRERMVKAANDARHQLQRDVHDGAQQRLVHTILALKLARDRGAHGMSTAALIQEALTHAEEANRQLRDLVRGILPVALTRGGLVAGIESFVTDLPVPVTLHLLLPRLPGTVETTGYFTAAEAITNAIKHAYAEHVDVAAWLSEAGDELHLRVRDDGVGGADPDMGTGLTGLTDRIEAAGGTITITSPPGSGTDLEVTLPLSPASQHDRDR